MYERDQHLGPFSHKISSHSALELRFQFHWNKKLCVLVCEINGAQFICKLLEALWDKVLHRASPLCTIFASLALADERVHV